MSSHATERETGRLFSMLAPRPVRRLLCLLLASRGPAALIVTVVGCSPAAPPGETAGWGGAPFVVWPAPASDSSAEDADNPWLTGEALGDAGTSVTGSGGAPAAPDDAPASVGGSPSVNASGGSGSGGKSSDPEPVVTPARLLLRAYVESSGSFKGVLVEHLGGAASGNCSVELYSNGSSEVWRRLAVPTGLTSGSQALLCVPDAAVSACTVGFGGSVFNGNDALLLRCDGQIQDFIGTVGTDPGKGWTGTGYDGNPVSTVDRGLWRCNDDPAPSGFAFDQWVDWDWAADTAWSGPTCNQAGWGGASSGP